MRISERKRRLREQSTSPIQHTAVTKKEPIQRSASTPKAGRATGAAKQARGSATQRPVRTPRTRGPRFYAGFGVIGLLLSGVLAWSTYSRHLDAVSKYHKDVASYPHLLATYKQNLAKYLATTVHKLPKPTMPAVPHEPVIGLTDFLLPILYGVLSLAYLYLAYRAVFQRKLAQQT